MRKIQLFLAFLCLGIFSNCNPGDENNEQAVNLPTSRQTIVPIAASEYISYRVLGGQTQYIVENLYAEVNEFGFKLSGRSTLPNGGLEFMMFEGYVFTPGIYTTSQIHLSGTQGPAYGSNNNTMQFNVTYIGAGVGDFINVSFNGTYYSTVPGRTKTITGFAHVRRDN